MHTQQLELQLLNPEYCLLSNFPITLPQHLLIAHQILPSKACKGYSVKIKMLNSLKRFIQEFGIVVPTLPNTAFRLHRPIITPKINLMKFHDKAFRFIGANSKKQPMENQYSRRFMIWNLRNHQIKFIQHFGTSYRRLILGDDWNMGKTVTVLSTLLAYKYSKILIATHSSLVPHWLQHLRYFCDAKNSALIRSDFEKWEIYSLLKFTKQKQTLKRGIYLVSYEQLNESETMQNLFELQILVLDKPPVGEEAIYQKLLCLSKQISHLIINQQIKHTQQTFSMIPLLNTKLTKAQMYQRYSAHFPTLHSTFSHQIEYQNALNSYYYFKSSQNQFRPPKIIKEQFISLCGEKKLSELPISLVQSDQIEQYYKLLGQIKVEAIVPYLATQLTINKQTKNYYLIYNQQSTASYLCASLKQSQLICQILHNSKQISKQLASEKTLIVCTLVEAFELIQKNKKAAGVELWENHNYHENMVIFCELYKRSQGEQIGEYVYKLFLLCAKIQYLLLVPPETLSENHQIITEISTLSKIFQLDSQLLRPQIQLQSLCGSSLIDPDCIEIQCDSGEKEHDEEIGMKPEQIPRERHSESSKKLQIQEFEDERKQIEIEKQIEFEKEKQGEDFQNMYEKLEIKEKNVEQQQLFIEEEQKKEIKCDPHQPVMIINVDQNPPYVQDKTIITPKKHSRAKKAVQHILTVRLIPKKSQLH